LTLSSFTILIVDTYKYLGVILHKQLQWKQHIQDVIRRATATSQQIARLATYTTQTRPPLKIIRQLIHTVLVPKIIYGLPLILLPSDPDHPLMRQLKRLLIIPLRKSLGLPHNAHHESIFIETRTLPIQYFQLHCSLLLAKRYICQTPSPHEQQQRHKQLFDASIGDHTIGLTPSNPLSYLRERCTSIKSQHTETASALVKATSKQIWEDVFNHFYKQWHTSQYNSPADQHSLFPCYKNLMQVKNELPLYLTVLSPSDASTLARLRFNRSKLNQTLFKRHRSNTDKCPSCPDTVETVEHVLMFCPRYDKYRFNCLCTLSSIVNKPPLVSMFPFPFLLCSFPDPITKSQQQQIISVISSFLRNVSRVRNM
jgi:hypothetical protein